MKLIHMHQLETLYLWYGVKGHQRSFGVTGSKMLKKKLKEFLFPDLSIVEFLIQSGTMHFACVHLYFFKPGSKVIKGVERSISSKLTQKLT